MKVFLKKISLQLLTALVLVSVILPFSFISQVGASSPTALSDTMTRQQVSIASSHTVVFTMSSSSAFSTGSTLVMDFGTPSFTLAAAATTDVSFNDGTARTVVAAGTAPACSAGANNVTVTTNTSTAVITITACSGYTASATGATVTFKIGTAVGGTNKLTNPGSNGSKKIALTGTGGYVDSASSFSVPILTLDQITVTAVVDPSITSSLSPTTCPMNATLTASTTGFCLVTNTVNTNATSGYTASVADLDATNPGKLCSPSPATCTNNIPAAATITHGTSGFGVRTSVAAQTVTNAGACADDTGQTSTTLTNTNKQYSSSVGPVTNDTPGLCYKAAISGSQTAGAYSEVSTHITTGNF